MKKGRHRRFEEARALKRSQDINLDELFESLRTDESRPAWADDEDLDEDLADRFADEDDEFADEEDDEDR